MPEPGIAIEDDDFYPYYEESVSESDAHRLARAYIDAALRGYFQDRLDVYVSSDMFVYYQKGDREKKKVSPDVFVCFGASKRLRKSYRTWEDVVPQVVFEITSESTRLVDLGDKRAKYTDMGVEEYYLFDPFGEWIPKQLRAYRREGDELMPLLTGDSVLSPRLGLRIQVEGTLLRLIDPETGQPLPTEQELGIQAKKAKAEAESAMAQADSAKAQAESAQAKAKSAEAELKRERQARMMLEEELRRLRSEN